MSGLYNTLKKPNIATLPQGYQVGYGADPSLGSDYVMDPNYGWQSDIVGNQTMQTSNINPVTTSGDGGLFSGSGFKDFFTGSNAGNNLQGLGGMLSGVSGIYSAMKSKDYYDDMSNIMNRQMGLYERELDRRNNTRQGYSTAFSGA